MEDFAKGKINHNVDGTATLHIANGDASFFMRPTVALHSALPRNAASPAAHLSFRYSAVAFKVYFLSEIFGVGLEDAP